MDWASLLRRKPIKVIVIGRNRQNINKVLKKMRWGFAKIPFKLQFSEMKNNP